MGGDPHPLLHRGDPMTQSRVHASTARFSRLLTAVALLALSGCGGEQSEQTGDDAPAVTRSEEESSGENPYWDATNLCELVPVQDVVSAAGGTEPMRAEPGTSPPPASCRYFFDMPDPYGPRNASATLHMISGGFGLERTGAGSAAQDVAGLGDEAWARAHTDSYLLYARRRDLAFSLNVAGVRDDARPEVARAIAGVVLAKLQ
jgi:hypothetical protein